MPSVLRKAHHRQRHLRVPGAPDMATKVLAFNGANLWRLAVYVRVYVCVCDIVCVWHSVCVCVK